MGPPRDPGPALSNATTPPRQPATQPSSVEDDAHRKRRPGTLSYPPARISPTEASTTARPPPASPHATSGLEAENVRLQAELDMTKSMLEVMGKAHALLETVSKSAPGKQQ
jgi:hypothetical protein